MKNFNKEPKIIAIADSYEEFETTYYDITDMEGGLKDFYECDEDMDIIFESYNDYEKDMLKRGARIINIIKYVI